MARGLQLGHHYPVDRADIGVEITGGQKKQPTTARFFSNLVATDVLRDYSKTTAWVNFFDKRNGKWIKSGTEKMTGLRVNGRWANVDGPLDKITFRYSPDDHHLTLNRQLAKQGSQYEETYCVRDNPVSALKSREVCARFLIPSDWFRSGYSPENSALSHTHALATIGKHQACESPSFRERSVEALNSTNPVPQKYDGFTRFDDEHVEWITAAVKSMDQSIHQVFASPSTNDASQKPVQSETSRHPLSDKLGSIEAK